MADQDKAPLRFVYRNSKGEVSERHLPVWQESGRYIVSVQPMRTFLKERIVEYLDGAAGVADPNPAPVARPSKNAKPDDRPQVLFTGFASTLRTELETASDAGGLRVVKTVTAALQYLVCGANAGPAKIEKSREKGVVLLTETQLRWLLETGEIPDS